MARTRKTKKTADPDLIIDDVDDSDDGSEEEQEESSPVFNEEPSVVVKQPPAPKTFYAVLQNAHSMTVMGKKFYKGKPVELPLKYYDKFKKHGWFRIVSRSAA